MKIEIQKIIIILTVILFGTEIILGQSRDMPIHQEPGKCYAKSLIIDQYVEIEETFPIYTGELNDKVELDSVYFRNDDKVGEFIYLGHEDDLTIDEIESLNLYEKVVYVKDTTENEDFVSETIIYQKLEKKGGYYEWKEVICGDKISKRTIRLLEKSLHEFGYLDVVENAKIITTRLKSALKEYQKDNNLPIGQLDKETLEKLDIRM